MLDHVVIGEARPAGRYGTPACARWSCSPASVMAPRPVQVEAEWTEPIPTAYDTDPRAPGPAAGLRPQGVSRVPGTLSTRVCDAGPAAQVGHQGHQRDGGFGQAANGLLFVAGIVATGDRSGLSPGASAGRPEGSRLSAPPTGKHLADVKAVAEHQVADDDQAPAIPQRPGSRIARAARAWGVHAHTKNQLRKRAVGVAHNRSRNALRTTRMGRVRKGSGYGHARVRNEPVPGRLRRS